MAWAVASPGRSFNRRWKVIFRFGTFLAVLDLGEGLEGGNVFGRDLYRGLQCLERFVVPVQSGQRHAFEQNRRTSFGAAWRAARA